MRTSFWTRLLDVVSPRPCVVCGQRLSPNEQALCSTCMLHLPLTGYEHQAKDNPMARLFWGQFPTERAAALFFYEPQADISRIIYEMKYHNHPETAEYMGQIAARHMATAGFFEGIDALVPMPVTRRRQWQRGYNQSVRIARGVSSLTGIPIYDKVVRRKHFKQSQTHQHAHERMLNVADAFSLIDARRIAGKHILIVDDIVTTGATIIACGCELAKAPGVSISVLSLGLTKS